MNRNSSASALSSMRKSLRGAVPVLLDWGGRNSPFARLLKPFPNTQHATSGRRSLIHQLQKIVLFSRHSTLAYKTSS